MSLFYISSIFPDENYLHGNQGTIMLRNILYTFIIALSCSSCISFHSHDPTSLADEKNIDIPLFDELHIWSKTDDLEGDRIGEDNVVKDSIKSLAHTIQFKELNDNHFNANNVFFGHWVGSPIKAYYFPLHENEIKNISKPTLVIYQLHKPLNMYGLGAFFTLSLFPVSGYQDFAHYHFIYYEPNKEPIYGEYLLKEKHHI